VSLAHPRSPSGRAIMAFARTEESSALFEFLAHRATENLRYHVLRDVTHDPWGDLEAGRHEALAEAELAWLGIRTRPAVRV
jgi:hypothetical protein